MVPKFNRIASQFSRRSPTLRPTDMDLVSIPWRKIITFTPPAQHPPESREIRKHMSRARHARHRLTSQSLSRANVYLTLGHETWRIFLSRVSAIFGERLLGMKVKRPVTLMPRKANLFPRTGRSAYHRISVRLIDSIEQLICAIYLKIELWDDTWTWREVCHVKMDGRLNSV